MSEKQQKRNWSNHNEALVQRGEILLSIESLKGWQQELQELNRGKNGNSSVIPAVDATGKGLREAPCGGVFSDQWLVTSHWSLSTGEVVRAYRSDAGGWKKAVGYGRRWMAESFFSGGKRLFGEAVHAKG